MVLSLIGPLWWELVTERAWPRWTEPPAAAQCQPLSPGGQDGVSCGNQSDALLGNLCGCQEWGGAGIWGHPQFLRLYTLYLGECHGKNEPTPLTAKGLKQNPAGVRDSEGVA